MMRTVAGILLAAGGSTRMGQPKQLMPYRGAPLVAHMARTMLASVCRPIVVVTGAHADYIRAALAGYEVTLVDNPRWREGIGTSVAAAVAHLSASPGVPGEAASGSLICLGDQPLVTPDLLNSLVQTLQTRDHLLAVACSYGGTLGVPAVFRRELFDELLRLDPSQGAKTVLQRHGDRVGTIPFEPAAVDVDTPEQYTQIKQP